METGVDHPDGFAFVRIGQRLQFRGVRFCEVADCPELPRFDLSAIWPARSVPTLADLFASLDLGPHPASG